MKKYLWILLAIIGVAAFLVASVYAFSLDQLNHPYELRDLIQGFGSLASIIYLGVLTIAIPLPTPSTWVVLAGGFVFGAMKGFALSMIGQILGASLAFYMIRHAGKHLLYKLVKKERIQKFNRLFKEEGVIAVLIFYALPILPGDFVSLFMGLTKIKYPLFILLVIIGYIPRILLVNFIGDDLYGGLSLKTVILVLIMVLFAVAVFLYRYHRKKRQKTAMGKIGQFWARLTEGFEID